MYSYIFIHYFWYVAIHTHVIFFLISPLRFAKLLMHAHPKFLYGVSAGSSCTRSHSYKYSKTFDIEQYYHK